MGGFFNFSLWDVLKHPVLTTTWNGAKIAAKGISSANAKAESDNATTTELSAVISAAQSGNSNAQCLLALHYIENRDIDKAGFWLSKSALQGNEHAIGILDLMQSRQNQ